jgi:hypothetical protein
VKLKLLYTGIFLCLLLLSSLPAMAKDSKGELTIDNWKNGEGTVSIPVMKLRYSLGTFFGEPTEQFIFYYESRDKFTEIFSLKLTAQVIAGGNLQNAFINIDPTIEPPGKWGWDVAGSPEWGKMFVAASGAAVSADDAQSFFKSGISLTNLKIDYINAKSGVNDEQYDAYASLMPASYVRSESGQRKLELDMPSFDYWNSSNSFWKDRVSAVSDRVTNVNTANSSEILLQNTDVKITTWKYGQYQHVVIAKGFSHRAGKNQESQEVEIDIIWNAWDSATTKKRTFRQTVRSGQMTMVAGDRIRRPLKKDGSLAQYDLRITVRFIDKDEKEEDPLEDLAEVDVLAAALEADQLTRTEEAIQQHQQDIEDTRIDNEKAYEAARLAAEKKERDRIAREEYLASDQYKIDQALKKKKAEEERLARENRLRLAREKQDALERTAQLALAAQREEERLQRLKEEEEERIKYGEFFVVVRRYVDVARPRVKNSCPSGRCIRLLGDSISTLTSVSRVFTVRYLSNPESAVVDNYLPSSLLNSRQLARLDTWLQQSRKYQGDLYFNYFLSKTDAEEYSNANIRDVSELYMDIPLPDLSW